jgi:hypothetical protein
MIILASSELFWLVVALHKKVIIDAGLRDVTVKTQMPRVKYALSRN